MPAFGDIVQGAQITTGNFRTTVDPPGSSTNLQGYPTTPGFPNILGIAYKDATISTANPNGLPTKYRYVKYQSTANAAVIAVPGPVFWADETFTVVTSTASESVTGGLNMPCGYLMPNSGDISGFTAAKLNGNGVWVAVAGFVAKAIATAACALDDLLIGSVTAWVPVRVATGAAAPVQTLIARCLTAQAASNCDLWITCESL